MVPLWGLGVRSRLLLAFFGITAFATLIHMSQGDFARLNATARHGSSAS
jgi:hypothetical protein